MVGRREVARLQERLGCGSGRFVVLPATGCRAQRGVRIAGAIPGWDPAQFTTPLPKRQEFTTDGKRLFMIGPEIDGDIRLITLKRA